MPVLGTAVLVLLGPDVCPTVPMYDFLTLLDGDTHQIPKTWVFFDFQFKMLTQGVLPEFFSYMVFSSIPLSK